MSSQPAATTPYTAAPARGSVLLGGLVMLGLAILLGWLPLLGSAIAGYVGGRVVVGAQRSVLTALIPAFAAAGLLAAMVIVFEPFSGALVGVVAFIAVAISQIPMVLGAWWGGTTASRR